MQKCVQTELWKYKKVEGQNDQNTLGAQLSYAFRSALRFQPESNFSCIVVTLQESAATLQILREIVRAPLHLTSVATLLMSTSTLWQFLYKFVSF